MRRAARLVVKPGRRRAHGPLGVAVPSTNATEGELPRQWHGPVVRLADLSDAERIAIGGRARDDIPPSVQETWLCRSCRSWTINGSYLTGRCCSCGTPRPTPGARSED